MSTTLHTILEPDGRVGVPAPRGTALLRLGFRPFYLGAALAAVALMALWPAVLMGRVPVAAGLAPTDWHAHEMIFGCVAAVVVGFLFTAGKAWTGLDTPRGPALAALVALWAAGRVAGLVGGAAVFAAVDAPFLPLVAGVFARLVVRARSRRNAGVALVLALLAAANLAFHAAVLGAWSVEPMRALHAGLALVVLLESVIGGRVIPAFTRSAIPGLELRGRPAVDRCAIGATAAGLALWLGGAPAWGSAPVLALAAGAHAVRLAGWQPGRTARRPVLWILHAPYAWIPLGLALLAASAAGMVARSAGVHALAVGATGGLVIGMITRTARGHTGRPIVASRAEVAAYALVMAAAVLRVGAALVPALWSPLVCAAGSAWIAAFGLYLWRFAPWLAAARVDGRDG
ncbi:MAG TPA: NnrS family protein [Burkholderiaceae bacterium]